MSKRSLFVPRLELKPYEYPELLQYMEAIRESYWLHTEFNYSSDVQDYKIGVTDKERSVITKAMLAISQVEVSVKRFWSNLYNYLPKPEIDMVGVSFGESEARHSDAYSNLLEMLGLNDMFTNLRSYPALMKRVEYMERIMANKDTSSPGFTLALVMFSLFVEHISLFGQFFIIMSFNKRRNQFKGMSNAIEATSKEEELHGRFGIELYRILREENPEIFTEEFYTTLRTIADEALTAEREIIAWIFEEGELDFIDKYTVENFILNRYNNSLEILGLGRPHEVDPKVVEDTAWFDIEVLSTKETDFFNKRSTDYSKRGKAITVDDLF